jgi:hypothetical protein
LNIKEVFKFHQALEKIKKKKILEILHIHNTVATSSCYWP